MSQVYFTLLPNYLPAVTNYPESQKYLQMRYKSLLPQIHVIGYAHFAKTIQMEFKHNYIPLLEKNLQQNFKNKIYLFSSVQFGCSVVSDSWRPHEPQHTRPPCPSPTSGVHLNPCPLS